MEKWKIFVLILFPRNYRDIWNISQLSQKLAINWADIDEIFRQRVIIFRVTSNLITGMNGQPG